MKDKQNDNVLFNKKRATAFTAVILAFLLLLTGTFAWKDYNQHKSNEFKTADVNHNVMLVEDFEPVDEWVEDQVKDKLVYVKNGNDQDNPDGVYDDAYIRLSLKEYMEISKRDYVYSSKRFMIDLEGNFYRASSKQDLAQLVADVKGLEEAQFIQEEGYYDDKQGAPSGGFWYVETKQGDVNGQYGKHLVKDINESSAKPVITASMAPGRQTSRVPDSQLASEHNHKVGESQECKYPIHAWQDDGSGNVEDISPIAEYIQLGLGDVMTLEDYESRVDKSSIKAWILDTRDVDTSEGWAYWSQPLKHQNHVTNADDAKTAPLLKTTTLIAQPKDSAYYNLHVDMEAVSFDDLKHWYNMPPSLAEEWGKETYNGQITIEYNGEITPGVDFPITVTGTYANGESIALSDMIISAEGKNYPVQVINNKLRTSPAEKGPVKVTARHRDGDLAITTSRSIPVKNMNYKIPNLDDKDHIVSPEDGLVDISLKPSNSNYEYSITGQHSSDTKINSNQELIIGFDETADEVELSVKLQGDIVYQTTVGIPQVKHVKMKDSNPQAGSKISRYKDYSFKAELVGNKYLAPADQKLVWSVEPALSGISIEAHPTRNEMILRVDDRVAVGSKFKVIAQSVYNESKTVSLLNYEVVVSASEIDRIKILPEALNMKPDTTTNINVEFYKANGDLLSDIDYQLSVDGSNEARIDHNKDLVLSPDFRDERIYLKVETIGLEPNQKEEQLQMNFKYLIDFDLSMDALNNEIKRGTKSQKLLISEDGIGDYSKVYSFNSNNPKVRIYKEADHYIIDIAKDASLGNATVEVTHTESGISKEIHFNIIANELEEKKVASIENVNLPQQLTNTDEVNIMDHIELKNYIGTVLNDPSQVNFELSSTRYASVDASGLLSISNDAIEEGLTLTIRSKDDVNVKLVHRFSIEPKVTKVKIFKGSQELSKDTDYQLSVHRDDHVTLKAQAYHQSGGQERRLNYPTTIFEFVSGFEPSDPNTQIQSNGELVVGAQEVLGNFKIKAVTSHQGSDIETIIDVSLELREADLSLVIEKPGNLLIFDANSAHFDLEAKIIDSVHGNSLSGYDFNYSIETSNSSESNLLKTELTQDGKLIFNTSNQPAQAQKELKVKVSVSVVGLSLNDSFETTLKPKASQIDFVSAPTMIVYDRDLSHDYEAKVLGFNGTELSDSVQISMAESDQGSKIDQGHLIIKKEEVESSLNVRFTSGELSESEAVEVQVQPASIVVEDQLASDEFLRPGESHQLDIKVLGKYGQNVIALKSYSVSSTDTNISVDSAGRIQVGALSSPGNHTITFTSNHAAVSTQISFEVKASVDTIEVADVPSDSMRPGESFDFRPVAKGNGEVLSYADGHFSAKITPSSRASVNEHGVLQIKSDASDGSVTVAISYKNADGSIIQSRTQTITVKAADYRLGEDFPTQDNPARYGVPKPLNLVNERGQSLSYSSVSFEGVHQGYRFINNDELLLDTEAEAGSVRLKFVLDDQNIGDHGVIVVDAYGSVITGIVLDNNLPTDLARNESYSMKGKATGYNLSETDKVVEILSTSDENLAKINSNDSSKIDVQEDAEVLESFTVQYHTVNYGGMTLDGSAYRVVLASDELNFIPKLKSYYTEDDEAVVGPLYSKDEFYLRIEGLYVGSKKLEGVSNLTKYAEDKTEDNNLNYLSISSDSQKINYQVKPNIFTEEVKVKYKLVSDYLNANIYEKDLETAGIKINTESDQTSGVGRLRENSSPEKGPGNFSWLLKFDKTANYDFQQRIDSDKLKFNLGLLDGYLPSTKIPKGDLFGKIEINVSASDSNSFELKLLVHMHPLLNDKAIKFNKLVEGDYDYESAFETEVDLSYEVGDLIQFGRELDRDADKYFEIMFIAEDEETSFSNNGETITLASLNKGTMLIMPTHALRKSEIEASGVQIENSRTGNRIIGENKKYGNNEEYFGFKFITEATAGYPYPSVGYEGTKKDGLKMVLDLYADAFLNKEEIIEGKNIAVNRALNQYVLNYIKPNEMHENFNFNNFNKEFKYLTQPYLDDLVSENSAQGKMFALGISDMNTYLKNNDLNSFTGQNIMLSSPGFNNETAASVYQLRQISATPLYNYIVGARGAFFINLSPSTS